MPDVPLPFGSAASRWFYVLYKGLLRRGHDVSGFATYSDEEQKKKALAINRTKKVVMKLTSKNPKEIVTTVVQKLLQ